MADTVITPGAYEKSDSGAAGWAVAVVILLAVIAFGIFVAPGLMRSRTGGNASTPAGINVDVHLPQGQQNNSGGTQPNPTPAQ